MKKKLYCFDFDGTLTTSDTLLEFIKYAKGKGRFLMVFLMYSPLLVLMKLHLYPNWKAKQRINIASFEKWYDSQSRYRTKEDREKDAIVEEATITMPEMARLLGLTRSQVYQILRNPKYSHFFETIVIAEKKRITKENFQKFLE